LQLTRLAAWRDDDSRFVLIVFSGVLVPIGLRLLAVPVIRAYECAVADRAQGLEA
jgi:hypothetical protein